MKFIFSKTLLYFSLVFFFFSCEKESLQPEVIDFPKVQSRTQSDDPFFDLMYTNDTLNLGVTRDGYYPFVANYMIDASTQMTKGSLFDLLKKENIYPCWYCGEPEYIGFHNYYIPFYDLDDSRLDGILILQENNNVKSSYYLSHALVDQIIEERIEPFSQYWKDIMDYFDGGTQGKNKKNHFNSRNEGCILSNTTNWCICENTAAPCYIGSVSDCAPSCTGDDGNDPGTEPEPGFDEPLTTNIENWFEKDYSGSGGTGNGTVDDSTPPWDDFCSGFDGSLGEASTTINEDGSIDIPLFENPADLYKIQLENFINNYGLQSQFTPKELMDFVGEECAVSNIDEVIACVKCHLINPLGLSHSKNWALIDDFDIVADCVGDPDPNCVNCGLAIKNFKNKFYLELTSDEEKAILEGIPSCGEGFNGNAMVIFLNKNDAFNIDEQQGYENLNDCEKELVKKNPPCALKIKENKDLAFSMTISKFGVNGRNDCSDAFRHAFFNALNTYSCSEENAMAFGDAHECNTPPDRLSEKAMDLHNNEIGRMIAVGNQNLTPLALANLICQEITLGNMKILEDTNDGNSALIDSDTCNCI